MRLGVAGMQGAAEVVERTANMWLSSTGANKEWKRGI